MSFSGPACLLVSDFCPATLKTLLVCLFRLRELDCFPGWRTQFQVPSCPPVIVRRLSESKCPSHEAGILVLTEHINNTKEGR